MARARGRSALATACRTANSAPAPPKLMLAPRARNTRPGPGAERGSRKRYLWCRAVGGVVDLEELRALEAEHAGDEVRGCLLDHDVVVAHRTVVVAPRELNLVLDFREVVLQLLEVGAGLQFRIGLGHGHHLADHRGDLALGLGARGNIGRATGLALRGGAQLGDLVKSAALVAGIALHGFD